MRKFDLTWHDVLIKKGMESSLAKSLIGFISWNKDETFHKLGQEISEILSDHDGKVFAKDVVSSKYNDMGLLFLSNDVSQDMANRLFDMIMEYEQEEVYRVQ